MTVSAGRPRHRLARRTMIVAVAALLLLLASAAVAQATTINVTTTSDPGGAGDCLTTDTACSLRQAVNAENGTTGGDTIALGSGNYSLTQGTDIIATSPFVLQGQGVGTSTIDGTQNSGANQFGNVARILRIDSGASVTIQNVTFFGGVDEEDENACSGCSTINYNGGGALFNNGGTVVLDHVDFSNNAGSGTPLGGAVSNGSGSLTMTDVSFSHDSSGVGGGLFVRSGTVNGNAVTFESDGTTCCDGGAAYLLGGTVTLTNTTVANSAGSFGNGAAIVNGGAALSLDNATLSNPIDIQTDNGATTNVENTILATTGSAACTAPGRTDGLTNGTSGNAITHDLGNNLDQGTSCGLSGTGDQSNVDPKLVPIFDNGGATRTEALLHGSPAIDSANATDCPPADQRGVSRPQPQGGGCDIGAFEAQFVGAPTTAVTGTASSVSDTSATMTGTINLDGEAGGFHFVYGTAPNNLGSSSQEFPAGVVSSDSSVSGPVSGLSPGTTYYYEIVADNASGSLQASSPQQFTTSTDPPAISNVNVTSTSDTTADISFTLDDGGADTNYSVEYGPDTNYGTTGPSGQLPAHSGPTSEQVEISGLSPNTTYHFHITATNGTAPDADSGDQTLTTAPQITGTAGNPITVTDSGSSDGCPQQATFTWNDDSANTDVTPDCTNGTNYTATAQHTYASPGHYQIDIAYDNGQTSTQYAQISAAPAAPTVTGISPSQGTKDGGTSVTITGTNFVANGTTVKFGNNTASSPVFNQDGTITAISPPSNAGTVDVTVTTAGGTSTTSSADQFTYFGPPTVSSISPAQGPTAGGTTVTINGTNLTRGSTVNFGSNTASNVVVNQAATQLTATSPPGGAGPVDVTVTTPGGTSAPSSADQFTYYPTPNISSINPTSGPTGGGTQVAIKGSGFTGATAVKFGSSNATIKSASDSELDVLAPGGSAGTVNVTVVNPIATSNAVQFTYTQTTPPPQTGKPTVNTFAPISNGKGKAGLTGVVNPEGLPTTAHYVYGLDAKYQPIGVTMYNLSTSTTTLPGDFASHSVAATIAGLLPNAVYHVRLIATNGNGQVIGPDQTIKTPGDAAPPPPSIGRKENVKPVSGTVFLLRNGELVPLTENTQLSTGTIVDTLHGSVSLLSASGLKGKKYTGTFGGALFRITQIAGGPNKGQTTLTLIEGANFTGAPSYASCTTPRSASAHAALSARVLQTLRSRVSGRYRSRGRYAAGTVRGTQWSTTDRCDGTLIAVQIHAVQVTDLVKHITVLVHAGHRYLALAHPPKHKKQKKHKH